MLNYSFGISIIIFEWILVVVFTVLSFFCEWDCVTIYLQVLNEHK